MRAVLRATRTIPIVIAAAVEPLGAGLVANLNTPGGSVTGVTIMSTDLAQKRLQLLREIVPDTTRVGLLTVAPMGPVIDPARSATTLIVSEMQTAAAARHRSRGAEDRRHKRRAACVRAVKAGARARSGGPGRAGHVRAPGGDPRPRGTTATAGDVRDSRFVDDGGLVSYGPDLAESYRRAATYDRILKGAKPGDLPVERPGNYEMILNLKTARALGRAIPQAMWLPADEVIQ